MFRIETEVVFLRTCTLHYRLLNLGSKRENLEILTTLLVILTVIQPFICIHPVIVWSQDSNNNSTFLLLVILIWFLPIAVHVVSRAVSVHGRPKWTVCANDGSGEKSIRDKWHSTDFVSCNSNSNSTEKNLVLMIGTFS